MNIIIIIIRVINLVVNDTKTRESPKQDKSSKNRVCELFRYTSVRIRDNKCAILEWKICGENVHEINNGMSILHLQI